MAEEILPILDRHPAARSLRPNVCFKSCTAGLILR
jgi:hypothetical protein